MTPEQEQQRASLEEEVAAGIRAYFDTIGLRMKPKTEADLAAAVISIIVDRCAEACEGQAKIFLSPEYAVAQPLSSFSERFACRQCAESVRALAGKS